MRPQAGDPRQPAPEPGWFQAVIKGGVHDNHVHIFRLEGGRPPASIRVDDGELRLQRVTDAIGRPIYLHGVRES